MTYCQIRPQARRTQLSPTVKAKHSIGSMPKARDSRESSARQSRSISKSPLASPTEESSDPLSRSSSNVAFVTLDIENFSVSQESKRAVRVQAAKSSAAARKRTIALKNQRKGSSSSATDSDRGRRLSSQTLSPTQLTFHGATSPSPGRSPARSPISEQIEAFRTYPTTQWHPLVPDLVQHFLRYFAPETDTDRLGREVLRDSLWPEALSHPALFHAILLTTGTHAAASRAHNVPMQLLAQFKHATLEHINEAVARAEVREGIEDDVVAAIALLGGWELDYGNQETYITHMRGLETIVSLRGGLYGRSSPQHGQKPLLPAITSLILNAGHDQALYACKAPYFGEQEEQVTFRSALPSGFEALRIQRLLLPSLMQAVSGLASQTPRDPRSAARLEDVQQALTRWSIAGTTRSSFSPSLTQLEDNIRRQATLHVRLAGLALCAFFQMTAGIDTQDDLPILYEEAQQGQAEILVHTVYEEVAFWALMIISSTSGLCEPRHMRTLKRLQEALGIADWKGACELLARFVYPAEVLESRAYALWEAVSFSVIARDTTSSFKEPNIYAKGIHHPTTWIGREVVAAEQ